MKLNTKYQGSTPSGFRQEDWPKGYNLNKHVKGPLGGSNGATGLSAVCDCGIS